MKPVIKRYHKAGFIAFMSLVMLITSFSCGSSPTQTTASPTQPPSAARTGDINIGPKVEAATQSIDSSGGTIAVSKPGDPLDGFVIDVPANSYAGSRTFTVSYAPITDQTFGSDITPISPMITVDNGGDYSDEIMYIRVPVNVPDGYFAMGFLYDEKTKQLEGMPLVGSDADSITVATSHFSNFFISMIEEALLNKNIESGFLPGIDDWQFDNVGSYITYGNCEGQSIAAMWYYYAKPDGKEARLYGRYDNNGNQPETPDLWQDDSLGYRFCSTIQMDCESSGLSAQLKWLALAGIKWEFENNSWKRTEVPGISDASQWRLFAYSIKASGQPQLATMESNAGGAHAMICYGVSGNGTLLVADPNYHGRNDRIIEYADGKFKPYNSGANKADIDAGKGKAYEKIMYAGAWTIVPYDKIAGRWTEFKNKTIGNDRFPAYDINVLDDSGAIIAPLTDGYSTDKKMLTLQSPTLALNAYRDGTWLTLDNKGAYELKPGNNLLGIYFTGKVGTKWLYVDFKYFNVVYEPKETPQPTPTAKTSPTLSPTASPVAGGGWYLDGQPVIEKEQFVNNEWYFNQSLDVTSGSALGAVTWSDGYSCGGTYTGSMNWTPPPDYMQPGGVINFSMTSATQVQNTCGSLSIGSGGWIKAEGTTIVKALDESAPSASGTYTVPNGSAGQTLNMWTTGGVANLHFTVYYNYVYK